MSKSLSARELNASIAKAMGQTEFAHPGFYWSEGYSRDGDGWDGFYCPRCGAYEGDTGLCAKMYSLEEMLNFMKSKGSSVLLNWGEDNDLWECSWITGAKRFTFVSKDMELAVKLVIDKAATEVVKNK